MSAIRGKVIGGKIELPAPADWPEGTEVVVQPVEVCIGIPDEDRPPTQKEIDRVLALMDQIEGPFLSGEEWTAWDSARKAQKECEKSKWEEESEKLRRLFE